MQLTGLHFLLTYQCTFECDHCFVWGSPFQRGTMTLAHIQHFLDQAKAVPGLTSVYFEGGEPFLYYPILVRAVERAAGMGFEVGLVSNAYWATSVRDAMAWLEPFQDLVVDLSVSSDRYHYAESLSRQVRNAQTAAQRLDIPVGLIAIAQPEAANAAPAVGQLPEGESGIMYRGRAADKLAPRADKSRWDRFTTCPYEDLREPGRLHLDPPGNLHICQGISIGNLYDRALINICTGYQPESHPITGPLLCGGPAELVRAYGLPLRGEYADACHLCYLARASLRSRFPESLGPDQMYGLI